MECKNECKDCINSEIIKEIKEEIKEHERRLRTIEEDKKLQTYQYEQIMETLKILREDVGELKDKPGKSWSSVTAAIITAIATGVVAFMLANILK